MVRWPLLLVAVACDADKPTATIDPAAGTGGTASDASGGSSSAGKGGTTGGLGGNGATSTAGLGGAAATGGTAGAPSPADAGHDKAWLADDTLLVPVPGFEDCGLREARLPAAALPRRTGGSCGDGCRTLPAGLPGFGAVPFECERTAEDGQMLYRIWAGDMLTWVVEILDVGAGTTLALHTAPQSRCGPVNVSSLGEVDRTAWMVPGGGPTHWGRWDYRSGVTTKIGVLDDLRVPFSVGTLDSWGRVAPFGLSVHIAPSWTTQEPLPKTADGPAHIIVAARNLFAWTNYVGAGGTGRISAARPGGTPYVLYDAPAGWVTMNAEIGDGWIVWTQGRRDGSNPPFSAMEIWRADLPAVGPVENPRRVAELPFRSSSGLVASDGVYATTVGFPGSYLTTSAGAAVVRLSDGKTWILGERSKEVIWGEVGPVGPGGAAFTEKRNGPQQNFDRFVIFDLDKLDALEQRFPFAPGG